MPFKSQNYTKLIFLNIFIVFCIKYWNLNEIKVCICTIGKMENLYAREYVSYYIDFGVDKIFIYDNNDINGERFENVIFDYIKKGFVEIINYRGQIKPQLKAYQECLKKNYKNYSWLLFYDMDEYLYLRNFKNIKNYLSKSRFNRCQTIQLNIFHHTDNDLFYYDNRSLFERFKKRKKRKNQAFKSILKGNLNIDINCVHNINDKLISCNGFGKMNKNEKYSIFYKNPDYQFNYIDHFCTKSTQEFIDKLNRGDAFFGPGNKIKFTKIKLYFNINKITNKKINYIENKTKLNISFYRNNNETIK